MSGWPKDILLSRHLSKRLRERMSPEDSEGKNALGRGNSKGKGPEVGACPSCSKDSKKGCYDGGAVNKGDEVREVMGT